MTITENTYIISDTHFGHDNIVAFEPSRMFLAGDLHSIPTDIDLINKVNYGLVLNWNSVIGKNDTVLHLGDLALGGYDKKKMWIKRLNGNIILIRGNHDSGNYAFYSELGIDLIEGAHLLLNGTYNFINTPKYVNAVITEIAGKRIMFSHLPVKNYTVRDAHYEPTTNKLLEIFTEYDCEINIHGHVHSHSVKESPFCVNASVEAIGFKPVRIKDILYERTIGRD